MNKVNNDVTKEKEDERRPKVTPRPTVIDGISNDHGGDETLHDSVNIDHIEAETGYHSVDSNSDCSIDPYRDEDIEDTEKEMDMPPPTNEFQGEENNHDDLYQDVECGEEQNKVEDTGNLYLGQLWGTIYECRRFLRRHAVKKKFEMTFKKNERHKVVVVCANSMHGCPWRCTASQQEDGHTIKVVRLNDEHECVVGNRKQNKMADCRFISTELEDVFKCQKKSYTVGMVIIERARTIALEKIYGDYAGSYSLLPEMCRQILKNNKCSIASVSTDDADNSFTGLCITYKPFIDGFKKGCRPVIGLDGTHLKGKYGGVILAAIALDGNNGIYCFRHLWANLKKMYKGDHTRHLVWGTAKAYTKYEYRVWAKTLKKHDQGAYEKLHEADVHTWARSHFDEGSKCEHITNNFSESFNSWILKPREMPIIPMCENFHTKMMNLLYDRRNKGKRWEKEMKGRYAGLVPRAARIINGLESHVVKYTCHGADDHLHQVTQDNTENRWIVNLTQKSCSCCTWQFTGLPCEHAVVVILPLRDPWIE
ncbi:uncharacterized protein LOC113279606 [Papaver somniferum]|uniref:uncharacterized protein LOC113279606 n=1 Tax=Papaver somniferum TaxID=3469 RepID=UPI000E6F4C39|nr:uncharacterized protein LOC113279606 [Papaver somniferum]